MVYGFCFCSAPGTKGVRHYSLVEEIGLCRKNVLTHLPYKIFQHSRAWDGPDLPPQSAILCHL